MLSYAALMTLLFGLFVVLYGMSRGDRAKQGAAAQSMSEAFAGGQPKPGSGLKFPGDAGDASPESGRGAAARGEEDSKFYDARSKISVALQGTQARQAGQALEDLRDQVALSEDARGLVIRIAARDLFAPGEAAVRPDMQPLLDRLCEGLSSTPHSIRVEGHTDPSEQRTVGYASDWDLAAARATGIVNLLVKRHGFDPARISAVSRSHFHPFSEGDDDRSRGKNRRVEIIVFNPQNEGA